MLDRTPRSINPNIEVFTDCISSEGIQRQFHDRREYNPATEPSGLHKAKSDSGPVRQRGHADVHDIRKRDRVLFTSVLHDKVSSVVVNLLNKVPREPSQQDETKNAQGDRHTINVGSSKGAPAKKQLSQKWRESRTRIGGKTLL
jgi:hypothetical protein